MEGASQECRLSDSVDPGYVYIYIYVYTYVRSRQNPVALPLTLVSCVSVQEPHLPLRKHTIVQRAVFKGDTLLCAQTHSF